MILGLLAIPFALLMVFLMVKMQRQIMAERKVQRANSDARAVQLAKNTAEQHFTSLRHYENAIDQLYDIRRQIYSQRTKAEVGSYLLKLEKQYAEAKQQKLPQRRRGGIVEYI